MPGCPPYTGVILEGTTTNSAGDRLYETPEPRHSDVLDEARWRGHRVGRFGFAERPCPVCQSGRSHLLYRQSFEQLSSARLLDGYDIVVCDDCGAAFSDDIPEQSVFDQYYRELSKYEEEGDTPADGPGLQERFKDVATLIAEFIEKPDARILEIGCGSAPLLGLLRERGFRNVLGAILHPVVPRPPGFYLVCPLLPAPFLPCRSLASPTTSSS